MDSDARYGIEELADLAGVTRRTVRFYVQEGLLPAPLGRGRGRHYGAAHLKRLLEVKTLQERGLPLAAIGDDRTRLPRAATPAPTVAAVPRSSWSRLELLPGVELSVSSAYRFPSPGTIRELAEWCRLHLRRETEDDDA